MKNSHLQQVSSGPHFLFHTVVLARLASPSCNSSLYLQLQSPVCCFRSTISAEILKQDRREENLEVDYYSDSIRLSKEQCIVEQYSRLLICFLVSHAKNSICFHLENANIRLFKMNQRSTLSANLKYKFSLKVYYFLPS